MADPAGSVEMDRLVRMRDLLRHRGPDDAGVWRDAGIALGHRRLSIIDVAGGQQPLSNEDGSVWVSYNGEIYNYVELRDQLRALGHVFDTRSDTEVLVHGYEEWGLDLPKHLNGIFGFALYDRNRKRLLLVRDHLGVKPLFYGVKNGELAFASEIRSVLSALEIDPNPRLEALQEYLIFRYLSWDRTFFDGVNRLPPGHIAVWMDGHLQIQRYWSPTTVPAPADNLSGPQAVQHLDQLLGQGVGRQLMSEVPLGAFCSGGVDSGLTTAYAVRDRDPSTFRTYSVALEAEEWDETELALENARSLGTRHETLTTRAPDVRRGMGELLQFGDEPLSHPNMVPLLELSRVARERVTVVLTGEGADEMFCGYPRYHIVRMRRLAEWLPGPVRIGLGLAAELAPGHRATKLGKAMEWSMDDAVLFNSSFVDPGVVEALTGFEVDGALDHRRKLIRETHVPGDPMASISRYELTTYLVSALERLDRVSMAVGLEARVPFLDVELVEWGLALSSRRKLRGRRNKAVVKELARGKLSPKILNARKSGFGLPLGDWFRSAEFAPLVEALGQKDHPACEMISPDVVENILSEHTSGTRNHGEVLWLLANLYAWFDLHLGAQTPLSETMTAG